MITARAIRRTFVLFLSLLAAVPAAAQQTGAMSGKVTDTSGGVLPGVTVEARADVLPSPRVTVTEASGEYRLPALPPGNYTVSFVLSGMQTVTRQAQVQLSQDTVVDASLGLQGVSETLNVTATVSLLERDNATIKSGVSNEQIMALPVGQEYRDLIKLVPGVQLSQDVVRGPSAGGSGQDNVYQFDGVNVTLPLFGTLAAEPASHDIAQVTTIKGGARAVDFDRSGGFSIDSVSKSGTNRYTGELSFQVQNHDMSSDLPPGVLSRYEQDRKWLVGNVGGPIVPNKLNFYGSYYRPERTRENRANLYGDLPPYESTRDEGFGKLTFTPVSSVLLNVSYRGSHRLDKSDLFASAASATTGTGYETRLKIGTGEGSWVVNSRSLLTFKYTHFVNERTGRPDNIADVAINTAPGTRIDTSALDQLGRLTVPAPVAGQDAYNQFVQPLIDRYGYVLNGNRVGGGTVGYGSQFDRDDFFRDSGQVAYNVDSREHRHARPALRLPALRRFGGTGAQLERVGRDHGAWRPPQLQRHADLLHRRVPAADHRPRPGHPLRIPVAEHRGERRHPLEDPVPSTPDLIASNDTLYGQGLREDSSTISGYVLAPGNKYKMHEIPFSKLVAAAAGHDLGLQHARHDLRQLRALQPGGQLPAARRIMGPQPGDHHQRALRRQRARCSPPPRWRPRRASCSTRT